MAIANAVDLRASDADRERVVQRLRHASIEGRLDATELEERLELAYGARHRGELAELTADLPAPPRAPRPAPAPVPVAPRAVPPFNALGVVALLCGLLWGLWLGSVAAVVMGHVALAQIARTGGAQRGRAVAVAALVVGYLGLLTLGVLLVVAGAVDR
jgi:hypothetical protein